MDKFNRNDLIGLGGLEKMLTHNVPWQGLLARGYTLETVFVAAMLLSVISGYFDWWVLFTVLFLTGGFFIIIQLIPVMLNLSRAYFVFVASNFFVHVSVTIIAFALHHKSAGLIGRSGLVEPSFWDALYFSVTTFTTLGYGDLQPIPAMRLATSIEALAGMVSMALFVSMIWLWCQENLVPKEIAFFDGNRRHRKSMAFSKIRIRTITGKERQLPDWRLPPQPGESYYYDRYRGEWLPVTPDTELPENAFVIGIQDEE